MSDEAKRALDKALVALNGAGTAMKDALDALGVGPLEYSANSITLDPPYAQGPMVVFNARTQTMTNWAVQGTVQLSLKPTGSSTEVWQMSMSNSGGNLWTISLSVSPPTNSLVPGIYKATARFVLTVPETKDASVQV